MKKRKSIFSIIVIPLLIFAIVVYLLYSAWNGLRNPYTFIAVYSDVMEDSVVTQGWAARTEQLISGGTQGLVQLRRVQGEKVAKGDTVAVVYEDEESLKNQEEFLQTQDNLTALQYATYSESPSGTALETQMMAALSELRTASSSGNYSKLSDQTENYRKMVLRREYLVSDEASAEMDVAIQELGEKYNALQSYQDGAITVKAAESGMFSSHLDGYETILNPDSLNGLSPTALTAFGELTPQDSGVSLGKLVTNPAWYFAALVPEDYGDRLSPGDNLDIYFDSITETLTMEVVSVGEAQDGQAVAVFRSTTDEHEAEILRHEQARLIFRSEEGILIPKEALRVSEDGENGVYVVKGYNARFRPVKILAENDTSYLVEAAPKNENDTRILRSGDELVLASAELYDGKVVH